MLALHILVSRVTSPGQQYHYLVSQVTSPGQQNSGGRAAFWESSWVWVKRVSQSQELSESESNSRSEVSGPCIGIYRVARAAGRLPGGDGQ